ncbi:YeeE/YedE thiosulfate transporter family protein [Allofournierella sp.]|uniref:YeeE/YedE thiosulfate transporter family protein n=1 Tax=Allofournierella sp. TaxID=1940256 RepID=UPI003AF0E9CB
MPDTNPTSGATAAPAAGSTSSIRRSSAAGGRARKKKKNQLPIGVLVFVLIVVVAVLLNTFLSSSLALFWVFGCCFGFILQKSRFCFTASLRDPCITGSTSVTRAVLIAFAITSIGFWAIKYGSFLTTGSIPGQSYVMPISLATVVGGVMFGIGMVIAGGCASGTLMRVGEGFGMQMLSLLFFVIGSLIGASHMGWWTVNFIAGAPRIFLPDVFGWFGSIVVQLLLIAALYFAAEKYEKKRMGITGDE